MGGVLKAALAPLLVYSTLAALFLGVLTVFEPIRVAGGSMEPALVAGDIAIVRRGDDPRIGDIALVCEPGREALLHRMVGRSGNGDLRLKGDANPIEDLRAVKPAHVGGTVARVIPVGVLLSGWRRR